MDQDPEVASGAPVRRGAGQVGDGPGAEGSEDLAGRIGDPVEVGLVRPLERAEERVERAGRLHGAQEVPGMEERPPAARVLVPERLVVQDPDELRRHGDAAADDLVGGGAREPVLLREEQVDQGRVVQRGVVGGLRHGFPLSSPDVIIAERPVGSVR